MDQKEAVKSFWEKNPLMSGEIIHDPHSTAFYEEHENIYKSDIFLKGIPTEFFPFKPGSKVLDVGCGPSIWTRELAKRGFQVFSVDLTNTAVEITKKSLQLFKLTADVQVGDAENLPFTAESFDGVVSHGVIHPTPNTEKCVQEMFRIIKPDGTVVISVYYKNIILRSKWLTQLIAFLFSKFIKLPGCGRDNLLGSADPAEIVRTYDGIDNPVGKAYIAHEFKKMFTDVGSSIMSTHRFYFPKRALGPFKF